MSLFNTKGDPDLGGIPPKSWIRLEAMPERRLLWEGRCSTEFSYDLGPGRYVMSITAPYLGRRPRKEIRTCYVMEFLHGCTEEQWDSLQNLYPRMSACINLTDGPHWYCRFPGCNSDESTRLGAAMHECRHFNINPLAPGALEAFDSQTPVVQMKPPVLVREGTREQVLDELPLAPLDTLD